MEQARRVAISYVATFLPAEAWHIYRQVCEVKAFRNIVVCRRRELPSQFPYEDLRRLRPPMYRGAWRALRRLAGKRPALTPAEVSQMLAIRAEEKASLVHVYLGSEAMRALPYLRRESAPRIVSFHGADLASGFDGESFRQLDAVADLFLCRSESLVSELEARGCKPEKIRLHRTGVPVGTYPVNRSEPGNSIRLFQACRFIGKKGIDCSIQALKMLRDQGMDCTLRLAGDGPELASLRELADRLSVCKDVQFLGFLDQVTLREEMETAHIFLHPSRVTSGGDREGIPNSLLEAMAAGMPVVATAHSGIPEAVESGKEGILTPENDVEAIAQAVSNVAEIETWRAMSLAAHRRIVSQFSTEAAATALETIYREVCRE